MQYERITPKSYPVNLIDKDWTKRVLQFRSPSKSFPDRIHDMKVLDDDVWLITIPKCGTTWMQELLWLLLNNCDFETALSKDLELRSPFLEFDFLLHGDVERALKPVEELPSPRLIKSHLPLALLPAELWQKRAKVVYVFRNLKDAWVSGYYHGVTIGHNYGKTLAEYINECLEGKEGKLGQVEHAAEFHQLRKQPWLYYTSFERMKLNLRAVIDDLCRFLSKTVTEEQMERLLKHLSFEEMKKNPMTNHKWELAQMRLPNTGKEYHHFTRRGKVNGYRDELPPALIEKMDRFIDKQLEKNRITLQELLLLNNLE